MKQIHPKQKSWTIAVVSILLLIGCSFAAKPIHAQNSGPQAPLLDDAEMRDFLIEDQCISWTPGPAVIDPADPRCIASINIGTTAVYYRTDNGNFQSMHSYARKDYLGNERIVSTMDFRQNSIKNSPTPMDLAVHEFNYDVGGSGHYRDGGNVAEFDGQYASFVGTLDPTEGPQTFYGTQSPPNNCSRINDAWILFGLDTNSEQVTRVHNYQFRESPFNKETCGTATPTVTDYFNGQYTYKNGKSLDTIVSMHVTGNAMEHQYFTREYGHTKWESWCNERSPKCLIHDVVKYQKVKAALLTTCAGTNDIDGWHRIGCREWTTINPMPAKRPLGYNLLAYSFELPVDEWARGAIFATTNLLINGDVGFHNADYWTIFNAPDEVVAATLQREQIGSGAEGFLNENWVYRFEQGAFGFGPESLASIRPIVWNQNLITLRYGFDLARMNSESIAGTDLQYRVELFDSTGRVVASSGLQSCAVTAAVDVWDRCEVTQSFNVAPGNLYPALYIEKNDQLARFDVDDIFVVVE